MKANSSTILLVEDNDDHAELVERNLTAFHPDLVILRASDGQEALDYLYQKGQDASERQKNFPKVILLDLKLPKIGGLEVLRTIKSDPELQVIPVVILTSSSAENDVESAYRNSVNSFVVKPPDYEKFSLLLGALGEYWIEWNESPGE